MQFYNHIIRDAGFLVEAVSVLGDYTVEFPHTVQLIDCLVPGVRFGF